MGAQIKERKWKNLRDSQEIINKNLLFPCFRMERGGEH
jgi:hypothetical protein